MMTGTGRQMVLKTGRVVKIISTDSTYNVIQLVNDKEVGSSVVINWSEVDYSKTDLWQNKDMNMAWLEDGYSVKHRNGAVRVYLRKTKSFHDATGSKTGCFGEYNLRMFHCDNIMLDIMEVYNRQDKLIWQRTEKSAQQIEIERIESEMEQLSVKQSKLAEDLYKLKGEI